MAGLTVAEKEHWKQRLSKRIDRRIETLAAEEPLLLPRVQQQARLLALESMGLAETQRNLDAVRKEKEKVHQHETELERQLLARVRGVHVSEISGTYGCDKEVNHAIKSRVDGREEVLLLESETGRRIVELRREKDHLLDTVWLASSPLQIKELWSKVATLLQDEPTSLEREALAIAPVTD